MFKKGDYITGVDRSYSRSIYQVIRMYKLKVKVQFICLDGRLGKPSDKMMRLAGEFRLATKAEVNKGLNLALSHNLIRFVKKLITQSSQERRWIGW